jgi:hypothetical protein
MTAPLERQLLAALDAEWDAQSARSQPLAPTRFVRDVLELAMAGTPDGIFAVTDRLGAEPSTPEELLALVRGDLPGSLDPWRERVLGRMRPPPRGAVALVRWEPVAAAPVLKPARQRELKPHRQSRRRAFAALFHRRRATAVGGEL